MTNASQNRERPPDHPAPPERSRRPPIDLEKLADKVYRLMLAEARLERARGAARAGRERSRS